MKIKDIFFIIDNRLKWKLKTIIRTLSYCKFWTSCFSCRQVKFLFILARGQVLSISISTPLVYIGLHYSCSMLNRIDYTVFIRCGNWRCAQRALKLHTNQWSFNTKTPIRFTEIHVALIPVNGVRFFEIQIQHLRIFWGRGGGGSFGSIWPNSSRAQEIKSCHVFLLFCYYFKLEKNMNFKSFVQM